MTDLILCEVLQEIPSDQQAARVLRDLRQFEIFDTGSQELAIAAARNYRHLRSRGLTVRKTIDCLIATFCIVGEHTLLHNDRDFDPFEEALALRDPQVATTTETLEAHLASTFAREQVLAGLSTSWVACPSCS